MKRQQKCYFALAAALLFQTLLPNASFAQTDMSNIRDMANNPPVGVGKAVKVSIKKFAFNPTTITVNKGDTVTWTNYDSAPHTATTVDGTSPDMAFDSKELDKGDAFSHTFTKAGTYHYICSYPHDMSATVIVIDAAQAATTH